MKNQKPHKIVISIISGALLYSSPIFAAPVCEGSSSPLSLTHSLAKSTRDMALCAIANKMDVQGHRGMDGYPNNTLESFRAGYKAGSETVELDLQITKDDRILVAHDPTLDGKRCVLKNDKQLSKTTLREMTFAESQEVLCAEKKSSEGAKARMPELADVFKEFKNTKTVTGKPARLNIEIKYDKNHPEYFPSPEKYVEQIVKSIRLGGWSQDRMIVQSFDHNILKILKAQAPDIEVVPLVGDAKDSLKAAKDLGSKMVTPSFTQLTPAIMDDLQKNKIKVVPWTPNSEEEIMKVISLGADGIITDRPDRFLEIRAKLCGKD